MHFRFNLTYDLWCGHAKTGANKVSELAGQATLASTQALARTRCTLPTAVLGPINRTSCAGILSAAAILPDLN